MPATYFPEGNTPMPYDDRLRSLHKQAWALYDTVGAKTCAQFPEANEPLVDDDETRLLQKINASLS